MENAIPVLNMTTFEECTYLAQVRRIRSLAQVALSRWPVDVTSCRFISHGENTTFRVATGSGRQFLLRIHRPNYHTPAAILEELNWLNTLAAEGEIKVPQPLPSKGARLLESVSALNVGVERHCCLLEWIEGRFLQKVVKRSHMMQLGRMLAILHRSGRQIRVAERRYWDADGLVGKTPKFGCLDSLPHASAEDQATIDGGRESVFRRLKQFQKAFPHKQGLIHADLHFGNVLFSKDGAAPIDFDDCGVGFYAYDLAVPLISLRHMLGKRRDKELSGMKDALIEGYAAGVGWDRDDESILPFLMTARKLAMVGWMRSRSDNPRVRQYLRKAIISTAQHLRS